jgi:hypothetical protein
MAMQSFITQRRFNKHATFKQRMIKLYGLLKLPERMIRYIGHRRKTRNNA